MSRRGANGKKKADKNCCSPLRKCIGRLGGCCCRQNEGTKYKQTEEDPKKNEENPNQLIKTNIQEDESAMRKVKESLHSVKVSKNDADRVVREIEGELFDKWSESYEVMSAKQILFDNIKEFLDHLHNDYEGIDECIRKKMNGVLFAETTWDYRLIEWKFNKGDDSGARYGLIAFGRSQDKKFVDCMYVMYKIDFKVSSQRIVTLKKDHSIFGILAYTTEKVEIRDGTLSLKSIQSMQNFFRTRALEGFYKEGLIDSINYVNSLEDK